MSSFIAAYIGGLLLAFTPCYLPMLPIVLQIIVQGATKIKAFILTLYYSLGISLGYALIGIFTVSLGVMLQAWVQSPFIVIPMGLLLIFLGAVQLGLIRITLPTNENKTYKMTKNIVTGTAIGNVLLGIASTIVLSPCITPALLAILSYISDIGNMYEGVLLLFTLGMGISTPLLGMALLGDKILPKSGRFMTAVKYISGLAVSGVGIYMIIGVL